MPPDAFTNLGTPNFVENRSLNIQDGESDVSDKQEEMIRYLREQKEKLSKQILELNARVKQLETTSKGDVSHIISRKNEELRLLAAEVRKHREEKKKVFDLFFFFKIKRDEYKSESEEYKRQLQRLENSVNVELDFHNK